MHTHKIKVTIPRNHKLSVTLPEEFPTGPAEVIVYAGVDSNSRILKLAGVLASNDSEVTKGDDPVADALQELRQERQRREENLVNDLERRKDS